MANYGYIVLSTCVTPAFAYKAIRAAMAACIDPRWDIEETAPGVWIVFLQGTEKTGREAADAVLADGDPVGFMVELARGGKRFAFRHGPNHFERWAQGRLEEQLADDLGIGVLYDATDRIMPPGTRWYRIGKTYREHLAAKLSTLGALSAEDEAYIERQMYCVPEGHR